MKIRMFIGKQDNDFDVQNLILHQPCCGYHSCQLLNDHICLAASYYDEKRRNIRMFTYRIRSNSYIYTHILVHNVNSPYKY